MEKKLRPYTWEGYPEPENWQEAMKVARKYLVPAYKLKVTYSEKSRRKKTGKNELKR